MEAKAKAGEEDLSMEEILQSIRKIIAEDGEEGSAAPAGEAAPAGSDVLELTEIVEEVTVAPTPVAAPAVPAAKPDAGNDILSKIDQVVVPDAPVPPAAPAVMQAPSAPFSSAPATTSQNYIDSLLSSDAASAAAAAFKKAIPMDTPIRTTPAMPLRNGATTIEDLVLETLKPMIKEWLDANLPTIVEKLVEREVKKLAH